MSDETVWFYAGEGRRGLTEDEKLAHEKIRVNISNRCADLNLCLFDNLCVFRPVYKITTAEDPVSCIAAFEDLDSVGNFLDYVESLHDKKNT